MVQKSGKLTSWGNGSSFPLRTKVLYMHPTGGFLAEFLNPSNSERTPQSWKQQKKIQRTQGFPPTQSWETPPQFSAQFFSRSKPLTPPPRGKTKHRVLASPKYLSSLATSEPSFIYLYLHPTEVTLTWRKKKPEKNAFNWWLFFFFWRRKLCAFYTFQEHMFRKLLKCRNKSLLAICIRGKNVFFDKEKANKRLLKWLSTDSAECTTHNNT